MESGLNCRLIASRRTRAVVIDASLQNLHRDLDVYAWACSRCSEIRPPSGVSWQGARDIKHL